MRVEQFLIDQTYIPRWFIRQYYSDKVIPQKFMIYCVDFLDGRVFVLYKDVVFLGGCQFTHINNTSVDEDSKSNNGHNNLISGEIAPGYPSKNYPSNYLLSIPSYKEISNFDVIIDSLIDGDDIIFDNIDKVIEGIYQGKVGWFYGIEKIKKRKKLSVKIEELW